MTLYFLILFGIYFLMLLGLLMGWSIAMQRPKIISKSIQGISVIIPFRNEVQNFRALIQSLSKVDYPRHLTEFIFVNDHSEDESERVLFLNIEEYKLSGFKYQSLRNESGKKRAISAGIQQATHPIIATTDADCIVPVNWLLSINDSFQEEKYQLSIGLVRIGGSNLWARLQRMEFFSVMAVTLASWAWKKPFMGNGANLAFRLSAFEQVNGYEQNFEIASGDDEFLLRKILNHYGSNATTVHDAQVNTAPQTSVISFFRQRLRWASKWKVAPMGWAKVFAVCMAVAQFCWWPLILTQIIAENKIGGMLILIKVLIEFLLLFQVCTHFKNKFDFISFLLLQILYAPYVVVVALLSPWVSVSWKTRSVG